MPVRRVICRVCGRSSHEPLPFAEARVRYTKWLARFVIGLRREMSIRAVAELTGLHWETVKTIEKKHLERKYRRVRLKEVRYLGMDEVYLGVKSGFITVVRDLESGAVLFIGKGRHAGALKGFRKRLVKKASQIVAVAMDMTATYGAWVKNVLPNAEIVYDHFHVIALMNRRLDELRRATMKQLTEHQKRELKGKRYLLLRNQESLGADAASELKKLQHDYNDLGTASLMKEYLRNIYRLAPDTGLARNAFHLWVEKAEVSGVHCLKQMSKSIRRHLDGILGYWTYGHLSNASQEGFNNKIGWLTRQAYGYRDETYLHLKIYDLPNVSPQRHL